MTTLEDIKRDLDSEIDRIAIYGSMPSQEQLLRDFRMWSRNIQLLMLDADRHAVLFETYEEQRLELTAHHETVSALLAKLERIKNYVIDTVDFGDEIK